MTPRLGSAFAIGERLFDGLAGAVVDLLVRAVLEDLESDVVVRRVTPREGQAFLHRRLDLDVSAVGGHGIVYGSLGGGQRDCIVLYSQHLADIADQATVERKVPAVLTETAPQTSDDGQQIPDRVRNRDSSIGSQTICHGDPPS